MIRTWFFAASVSSAVLFAGCTGSSKPADLPKLYSCTLTVTQEGKPLPGAVIELIAQETGSAKYVPVQRTDADGISVMTTYGFDGVPAGKYKVVVTKNIEEETAVQDKDTGESILVAGTKYRMVEPVYSDAKTTPLEIEITGKGTKTSQTLDAGKAIKVKF